MPKRLSFEHFNSAFADNIEICLLPTVDSTNEWVLDRARSGADLPLACFAEEQTRGRGRRGSRWISVPGESITMSFAWRFGLAANQIQTLSLVMGIAVIHTLERAGIDNAQLKWPNDVLVGHKKIAGVLIELAKISDTEVVVVTGIGLNYHLPDTLAELPDQPWTDVLSEMPADEVPDRNQLAVDLLENCAMICRSYPHNMHRLMAEYREKYDACQGNAVTVSLATGEQLEGIAGGVTDSGEIRVLIQGEERMFNSAEISLKNRADLVRGRPC